MTNLEIFSRNIVNFFTSFLSTFCATCLVFSFWFHKVPQLSLRCSTEDFLHSIHVLLGNKKRVQPRGAVPCLYRNLKTWTYQSINSIDVILRILLRRKPCYASLNSKKKEQQRCSLWSKFITWSKYQTSK